ncbi:MAG: helicase-related protein [Acutalibacteraceae bacterium]
MTEEQLSSVWQQLLDAQLDVLVCTTIIETGVDIPNVNTLIIEHADRMGLAQLHQIRGRVGRSSRRAFAYFTYTRGRGADGYCYQAAGGHPGIHGVRLRV